MSIDRTASGYLLPPIKEALLSTRRGSDANSLPCPPGHLDNKMGIQNSNQRLANETEPSENIRSLSTLKSDNGACIPTERFRLQRRLSEPGSTHFAPLSRTAVYKDRSSSGSSTDLSNSSIKSKQMKRETLVKKILTKQHKQDAKCDKTVANDHKNIDANFETNPQEVYNWTRRRSMPDNLESQVIKDYKTGTFLISKFGIEKQMSKGSFQNMKFARRVSLPNTSTSDVHLETIKENQTACLLSKAKSKVTKKYHGILHRQSISNGGLSSSDTSSVNQLNSIENTASESKFKTDSDSVLPKIKHSSRYMANRKLSDPGKTITDFHEKKKKSFCPTTTSAIVKTNVITATRRGPKQSRRVSDPVGDTNAGFGLQLPAEGDAYCAGIDIQKWLETSNPCLDVPLDDIMDPDQYDEPDSESQLLQTGRISVDDHHRSISQLLGNSHNAFDNESEIKSVDNMSENEDVDEDFLIRDIIGSMDDIDEDLKQFRNMTVMEQLNQDNAGQKDLNMRRHTIASDDDGYLQAIKYKPKPCYCLRCQIMNAMYLNGDVQLDNWGNYPCFRR